ncbi:hypothetical protein F444_14036, partial [Phytophthora nicotianae P1976]
TGDFTAEWYTWNGGFRRGVRGDYYSWNGIEAVDEEKTVDDEPFTTKTASVEKSETIVGFGFGTG